MTVTLSVQTLCEVQSFYQEQIVAGAWKELQEIDYLLARTDLGAYYSRDGYHRLCQYAQTTRMRITLIDSAGLVVFDSNIAEDSLLTIANHADRPEIQQALRQGFASDIRMSHTLSLPMFYAALQIERQPAFRQEAARQVRFIRVAMPMVEISRGLKKLTWKTLGGGGLALLLIALLSLWVSDRLTSPIKSLSTVAESAKKGNLDVHFEHKSQDEIGDLADLLNEMLAKLREDFIKLRKLEMVRNQFLGNVSHELRTPIFAVQGYLETLLDKDMKKETRKEFIVKAYQQAGRLNNLLTDLIDISRIESGEMKMNFHDFRLKSWLQKQVDELQGKAREQSVQLTFRAGDSADFLVSGDQERLSQVMVNLIENAIKYNVRDGKVEVGYKNLNAEAQIYISDTGRGIAAEHLPRIFERFYRVDKERSRAVGGTGLGLAIVKHIVEAHGSRVTVSSDVGTGSQFSFTLKIAKSESLHQNQNAS